MKKELMRLILPAVAAGLFVSGCADSRLVAARQPGTRSNPAGELVVTEPPLPPHEEMFDNAPEEAHVWVSGSWLQWNGDWVWLPPHWE